LTDRKLVCPQIICYTNGIAPAPSLGVSAVTWERDSPDTLWLKFSSVCEVIFIITGHFLLGSAQPLEHLDVKGLIIFS